MNDDLSDRKLFQTEIKTLQKNLNKDNLIIPYYQSDKWMNLLKKKVGTMAQEYNEYLRLNMEQYNPMKKKIKDLDKENQLKEAELINVDTLENPFLNRTNGFGIRDVNRLQQTSLYKMFPKFRNRTSHSFYSAKHRNSKVKKISFFGNNYVEDITEQIVSDSLYTVGQPDPEIVIRTSGELRLSNFLLWQLAYSELYFTNVLWPEFNIEEYHKALLEFGNRNRRFGGR